MHEKFIGILIAIESIDQFWKKAASRQTEIFNTQLWYTSAFI